MPPVEPCHEEDHFWNFMESDEAFHFNLKCSSCDAVVHLDELVGLMMCTGCDETCPVDELRRELEPQRTLICIALGCRPIEERKQLGEDKFAALEEYFSQPDNAGIKVVPHKMVKRIARCRAEVVRNVEMLCAMADAGK
jgi:hypothetical protein